MKIHEYSVNHDAKWLIGVCRLMITSSEIAKNLEYDKGWNEALHRVIAIIEDGMIPHEDKGENK